MAAAALAGGPAGLARGGWGFGHGRLSLGFWGRLDVRGEQKRFDLVDIEPKPGRYLTQDDAGVVQPAHPLFKRRHHSTPRSERSRRERAAAARCISMTSSIASGDCGSR